MQLGLQLSFDSKQIDDIRSGVYLGEVRTLDSKLHQGSDCTFSHFFFIARLHRLLLFVAKWCICIGLF